jgi:hypothetical protein
VDVTGGGVITLAILAAFLLGVAIGYACRHSAPEIVLFDNDLMLVDARRRYHVHRLGEGVQDG